MSFICMGSSKRELLNRKGPPIAQLRPNWQFALKVLKICKKFVKRRKHLGRIRTCGKPYSTTCGSALDHLAIVHMTSFRALLLEVYMLSYSNLLVK